MLVGYYYSKNSLAADLLYPLKALDTAYVLFFLTRDNQ